MQLIGLRAGEEVTCRIGESEGIFGADTDHAHGHAGARRVGDRKESRAQSRLTASAPIAAEPKQPSLTQRQ